MKVLVCGGRDYDDREFVFSTLNTIHATEPITCIVHGASRGADSLAADWAVENGVKVKAYLANWSKYGRGAGPIRNSAMLEGEPDIGCCVAFPGGVGTEDMIRKAEKKGVYTIVHRTKREKGQS